MSIIEVSVSITAFVGVIWLGIAAVKTTNHRFSKIETDINRGKERHIECSVEVKTKLEAFEKTQDKMDGKLDYLVRWAKNGGSDA